MKKMDEMDRSSQLRAEELAYKAVLGALIVWTCATWSNALLHRLPPDLLPGLILCLAVCIQGFSQLLIKQKMVAGDEESQELNHIARILVATVAVISFLVCTGLLLLKV